MTRKLLKTITFPGVLKKITFLGGKTVKISDIHRVIDLAPFIFELVLFALVHTGNVSTETAEAVKTYVMRAFAAIKWALKFYELYDEMSKGQDETAKEILDEK